MAAIGDIRDKMVFSVSYKLEFGKAETKENGEVRFPFYIEIRVYWTKSENTCQTVFWACAPKEFVSLFNPDKKKASDYNIHNDHLYFSGTGHRAGGYGYNKENDSAGSIFRCITPNEKEFIMGGDDPYSILYSIGGKLFQEFEMPFHITKSHN